MAFCTNCGATVQGAFCQQCGTPANAAAGQASASGAPAAMPAAMSPAGMPPAAAPVKRKTSPIVWILVGILGFFALCVIGLMAVGFFIARNPGKVMAKLITAGNPNVEVLNTDIGSKTMRIRDKKTGKEMTVSFDDVKNGKIRFSATDEEGKVANVEIGGGAGKMPSWVPTYPGATAEGSMTASGQDENGQGEGGIVTFSTGDPASKVLSFYQDKAKELGMKVELTTTGNDGGMVMATDEEGGRTLHVVAGGGGDKTTISVTFGRKR